jgi:hypothetical protein
MSSREKEASPVVPVPPPPAEKAAELEKEIEGIRGKLDGMVGELDRRRHELFDVKAQLRRHAVPLVAVAVALLGIAGGGIALGISRRRKQRRVGARLTRLQQAVRRMIAQPDQVAATTPGVGQKIAGAGGAAAASIVVKALARRVLNERGARRT